MSTTEPEALRENYTAADMATAAAQGFRDGVASVAAGAGSEPVAIYHGRCVIDCGAHGHLDMELLKMIPAGTKLYTRPSPPEGAEWRQGVEAAAALLSKKADDFAQEHGYDDMGSLSFGRGAHADAKLEYHSTLLELAEEIRSLAPPPPAQAADSVLEDAARYRHIRDVPHSEEVRSVLSLQQNAVMDKVIDKDRAAMAAKKGDTHE